MFDRPLPVEVEPLAGESGAGFCLRLASRNGLSLVELRRLLDMSAVDSFKHHHVLRLAMLAQLDPARLEQQFVAPLRGIRTGLRFAGHSLRLRASYRGRRPQVCPACIQRYRYCRTEWDLTSACVCLEHMCFLIDRCPSCDTALRWDRPSIEWSHCRHFLGQGSPAATSVDMSFFEMQSVLQALLTDTPLPSLSFAWPFPGVPSLDGWLSLVWAFGTLTSPHQVPRPGTFSSVPNSVAAREVVSRAHARMTAFATRHTKPCPELATLIAEAPLVGLLCDSDRETDRGIAMEVYRFISGDRGLDAILRRHRVSTQLSLFG